jgi:serine/threonine-protein kinase
MSGETTTRDLAQMEVRFAENPTDVDLLGRLSAQYYARGIFNDRARDIYQKALRVAPRDPQLISGLNIATFLRQLRRFTVESGQHEQLDPDGVQESINLVRGYLKELSASPDLFFALGDLYMVKGNVLLATGAYENAIKFGFQNYRAILSTYEFVSAHHTFQPSERAYFANLYRLVGMPDKAADIYRVVVRDGFDDPQVIASLIGLVEEAATSETNQNLLNTYVMEVAELQLARGDTDGALDAFRRVRFPVNRNYELVKRVASILIDRQDYRLAFDYLSKIPVDDENKALLNRITVELEKVGELDTAVYLLQFINDNDLLIREARALREKEVEIHTELALGEYNAGNGRHDLALDNYTKVLRLGYKEDQSVLAKIVELLPLVKLDHSDDFHFIGQYYLSRGDYYRASQFYDLVLEHHHDDSRARGKLREIYDAILQRNPNLPELRLRSGDLHLDAGDLKAAVGDYRQAVLFPETNIEATRRLAVAYMQLEDYTEALDAYQSMPVGENDLENLYQLHLILAGRSRMPDALGLLRLIVEVDDTYRDAVERIEMLRDQVAGEEHSMFVDPQMRELIGELAIGRYRYMEKIGSGGMGVVHKVWDLKHEMAVAMKILREGLASSGKAVDRFFREARIAATLNHPNIVNIYDYNINNLTHQSYISMEFVDGPSVRDIFEEYFVNAPPPMNLRVQEALYYLAQVCDALRVTHSKGIIHRDIKPDNILISSARTAKITDFGIVHVEEATFTPTGALIGTPRYMAPEQVQGSRLDGRADLYSAGIIFYEWLVGMPPFVTGDVAYQQVNVKPVPPAELDSDIPPAVNALICKSLEKNPADRFQTALDMKRELEETLRRLYPNPTLPRPKGRREGETDMDTI